MPQKKQPIETEGYEGFPELAPVMEHIRARKSDQTAEKAALLDKWLRQLETINGEMRKLEKIEQFSQAVTPRK